VIVRASGTFEAKWDKEPAFDTGEGASLYRATVTKQFQGDLEGSSVAYLLQALADTPGSAGYVAIERVVGTLRGRNGTFVIQHNGIMGDGDPQLTVTIVPNTGTGELKGIRGTLEFDTGHTYHLDYTLGES